MPTPLRGTKEHNSPWRGSAPCELFLCRARMKSFIAICVLAALLPCIVTGHSTGKVLLDKTENGVFELPTVVIQSGCVSQQEALIWGRCLGASDMLAMVSSSEDFTGANMFSGPSVDATSDYTGKVFVTGLTAGTQYWYKVVCGDDESLVGKFKTAAAPDDAAPVKFVWVADMGGQGWGRSDDVSITAFDGEVIKGGFVFARVLTKLAPDFAVLAGDMIYADDLILPEKEIPEELGGGIRTQSPTKDFVDITVDDYRNNWKYNLQDEKWAEFLRNTPVFVEWDDNEVTSNWYPDEILPEDPFMGMPASELAARSRQALDDFNPVKDDVPMWKSVQFGKHLEIFITDVRSFRGMNPNNSDVEGIDMMGPEQVAWLKQALKSSTATWKILAISDPFSIESGGEGDNDAWSQGKADVLGREVELAGILKFIKDEGITNVHSITADVHFSAVLKYNPDVAVFKDFTPFYEFVTGPVHAGSFGVADKLDLSFGPSYQFVRGTNTEGFLTYNFPPPYVASFGSMEVDAAGNLTVNIHDINGDVLWTQTFTPQ